MCKTQRSEGEGGRNIHDFLKLKIITDMGTASYLNKVKPPHFNIVMQDIKIEWGAEQSRGLAPRFLDLDTSSRSVASSTILPLYPDTPLIGRIGEHRSRS